MTVQDARYYEDTVDDVIEAMIANAKDSFGEDLNDDQYAAFRLFYEPIARKIVDLQGDIGLVLDSSQIDYATGKSLDLLTSLIGVKRNSSEKATGTVEFSRSSTADKDYTISSGTEVQTSSATPLVYETTETVILSSGTTSVTADVESVEGGEEYNTSSNTVVELTNSVEGVEDVTNPSPIDGGKDREPDDELRERAKNQLADGSRASAPALVNMASKIDGVRSVSIFINDTSSDNTGSGGLPDHAFELVIEGGDQAVIGQELLETKAAGDTSYGGANGTAITVTADLGNGQTHDVNFSRPGEVKIYVDMDISTNDEYAGDNEVRDSIVQYIGGFLSTGGEDPGELRVGDNVIYTQVLAEIQNVEGVVDVPTLYVDTVSGGTNSSNIAISSSDVATSDATDSSITMTQV